MLKKLRRFFSPPSGDADPESVRSELLSSVLNVYVVAGLGLAFLYWRNRPHALAVPVAAVATALMALVMRGLLHRGRARLASWIFLTLMAVAAPGVSIYSTGSVAVVSVSIIQMMLIVMAGLLLGGREALAFAVMVVAGNGVLFYRESLASSPERGLALTAGWILQAVFYTATGVLLAQAIGLIERSFAIAAREAAERRAAEEALRHSMERYRLITGVSSDYTFSTELADTPGLQLNWVAGAFERITGYTFDEYVARGGWRTCVHPDDLDQDTRDLAALRENKPIASELRTICKDGTVRWVRIYAHPVWNEAGNRLSGIFGAVQDIGERKVAEAEREALIRELEARNAELERFTYTVSHDLKSPLITIRGFLGHIELAAIEGRKNDVRADMERVYRSTAKMHQLLDDLLELSRIGRVAKTPEEIPFEVIVKDAVDRAHGRLAADGIVVEFDNPLPQVRVDRDRLVEVMQNLIDNAAKFMGDQSEPRIHIGVRDRESERAFFVRDNGAGIEPQYCDRVFNLFDKLDPKSAGTGIGLALVKRIIEVHGGRIWVESAGKGQGSTFFFTLEGHVPGGFAA
jgi:PAS domain S-box-containing protein